MNLNEVTVSASTVGVPRDRYSARVLKADFKRSDAGNPMVALECEIMGRDNDTVVEDVTGKKVDVGGAKFTMYLVMAKKSWESVRHFHTVLNLPMEIDENSPDLSVYDKLQFDAIISSQPNVKRMAPKPGQKVGDPIKDANGKEISLGFNTSCFPNEVLGPSTFTGGAGKF